MVGTPGDEKVQPILRPATTLEVVPKVGPDDLRNVHILAATERKRQNVQVFGMVQSVKVEDMSQIPTQVKFLQVVKLYSRGGPAVIAIRDCTPEKYASLKGRIGGKY